MADEQFMITYDGPALESNRMDVRLLAPALLGLADVLQHANRVVNPGVGQPGLHIEASRTGSFAVELLLTDPGTAIERVVDLFSGRESTAAANALAILGAATGAVGFLVHLARKKIRRQDDIRPGWVRITFDDNTTLDLPAEAVSLAEDLAFRRAAAQMIEPLRMEGIDVMFITRQQTEVVRVVEADLPGFEIPPEGEVLLTDTTREVALRLLNVAFVPGNKWRVADGENDIWVVVADLSFLQRVETNQEAFTAGDILRCQLRTEQWQLPNGSIRNDYTVTTVIEHRKGPRTVPLPFEEQEPEPELDRWHEAPDPLPDEPPDPQVY